MDACVVPSLKNALVNGIESLPRGPGRHRRFSYADQEYLIRTLSSDLDTITRLKELNRSDHHTPDIITHDDQIFEVQRYLPNPALCTRSLCEEEAIAAYERVWNAIGACHEAGIGHGDVHTDNILYDDGEVKVIDWEFARARDAPSRIPWLDLTHYDYAGLAYIGRALFSDRSDAADAFPESFRRLKTSEALEGVVSRISAHLNLPRFA